MPTILTSYNFSRSLVISPTDHTARYTISRLRIGTFIC